MGAGIAASPHFPELQMVSHEGKTFFTRRIDPLSGSCDPMSFRSGLPVPALLPSQAPFRDTAGHCCSATSLSRFQAEARFRRTVRKVGSALACAFASRFFLARPASRFLRFQPCGLSRSPRWRQSRAPCRFRPAAPGLHMEVVPVCRVAQADSFGFRTIVVGLYVGSLWAGCG